MRPHGHSYRVEVILEGLTLNEHGFVQDYRDLEPIKTFIDKVLDHQDLNKILVDTLPQPGGAAHARLFPTTTAETIAWVLFETFKSQFPKLAEIRVSETQKTWASYRPTPSMDPTCSEPCDGCSHH
jgi:6-pyruvoyltetrahydropterin/6-carboxytetrahydropterin synthase